MRRAVHAVALAGGRRAVVEDVAEMAAAAPAMHLGPNHEQAAVLARADSVRERCGEARPAGAAVELRRRREQRQVAAGATEGAWPMLVVRAGSSRAARCRARAALDTARASGPFATRRRSWSPRTYSARSPAIADPRPRCSRQALRAHRRAPPQETYVFASWMPRPPEVTVDPSARDCRGSRV